MTATDTGINYQHELSVLHVSENRIVSPSRGWERPQTHREHRETTRVPLADRFGNLSSDCRYPPAGGPVGKWWWLDACFCMLGQVEFCKLKLIRWSEDSCYFSDSPEAPSIATAASVRALFRSCISSNFPLSLCKFLYQYISPLKSFGALNCWAFNIELLNGEYLPTSLPNTSSVCEVVHLHCRLAVVLCPIYEIHGGYESCGFFCMISMEDYCLVSNICNNPEILRVIHSDHWLALACHRSCKTELLWRCWIRRSHTISVGLILFHNFSTGGVESKETHK